MELVLRWIYRDSKVIVRVDGYILNEWYILPKENHMEFTSEQLIEKFGRDVYEYITYYPERHQKTINVDRLDQTQIQTLSYILSLI